jgi:hypothetical protein
MRRILATLGAAVVLTLVAGTALAYWTAGSVAGSGGAAVASSVNQGATPTASAAGANVTVSWAAATLANGVPVSGYLVKRYDASTSAAQTVLAGCAGTVAATSCVEAGVPDGSWRYTVTPLLATNWRGAESAKSTNVVIDTTAPGAPAFTGISSDSGASSTDRITSTASQTLSGTAEAGSSVTVRRGATVVGTATATGGVFSVGPVTLTAGTNNFTATATDAAGNTSVVSATFTVTLDDVEPFSVAISPSDSAWHTSGSWTVTANDALSGIAQVSYSVDAGAYANLAASNGTPVSPPALGEGVHTVYAYATDVAGKTTSGTPVNATVKVDTTKPTAAITLAPSGSGGWRVSGSASVTGTDATSGVDHVEYRIDSGSFVSIASGATFTVPDGTHSVTYRAVDVAGNVGDPVTVSNVKVDSVKPQSTVTPAGSTSWRNSGSVTLAATDATSGVVSIDYKLDGAATYTTYAGPLTLSDGTHTLVVRAVDAAGNIEADSTSTIKVDTQAPTANLSQTGQGQPTLSGTDQAALSGVASVSYRVGNTGAYVTVPGSSTVLNLATGTSTVWRYATDNAGNQSTPVSSAVTVDATGPTTSNAVPAEGAQGTSWTDLDCSFFGFGTQRICADVTDSNGVSSVSFQLVRQDGRCYDGSAFVVGPCGAQPMTAFLGRYYSDTISTATMNAVEGRFTLTISATDAVGNVSTTTTHFIIDSAAPTATITPASSSTWRTSGAVTVAGTDAFGIDKVFYRVDANAGAFTAVSGNLATFTLPNGAHTVDYYVTDLAGKTSTQVDNAQINVDTVAPVITNVEPVNGANNGWAAIDCAAAGASAGRICATVTDAGGSALVTPTMSLVRQGDNRCWDGSDFGQTTCAPVTMSLLSGSVYRSPAQLTRAASGATNFLNGTYVLTITGTDNAGNSTTQTVTFSVNGA